MEKIVPWLFWGFLFCMLFSVVVEKIEYLFKDDSKKTNKWKGGNVLSKQEDMMHTFKAMILDYIRENGLPIKLVIESLEDVKSFMVENATLEKLTPKKDEN